MRGRDASCAAVIRRKFGRRGQAVLVHQQHSLMVGEGRIPPLRKWRGSRGDLSPALQGLSPARLSGGIAFADDEEIRRSVFEFAQVELYNILALLIPDAFDDPLVELFVLDLSGLGQACGGQIQVCSRIIEE